MRRANNINQSVNAPFFILFAICIGLASGSAHAARLDLELARGLIVEGKPGEAYTLLEPYEFEQAGNTKFDYLLGLAALNSGQADKASIILERVLVTAPLHAAARVDLGRAYYLLGDFERARAEFARAQELNPPPSAQATIILYQKKMEPVDRKVSTRLSGYFEGSAGYNTNVNNASSQSQVTIPILLNTQIALNSANVKVADGYWGLAAGGEAQHQISSEWSLYGGLDMRSRNDLKYHDFDILTLDGKLGAAYNKNAEYFSGGWVMGQFDLGGAVNHKSDGFNAEWKHTYNADNQSVLFGQYILYRYPASALASNNFNQAIVGLSWIHDLADGRTTFSGSFYMGSEHDTNLRIDGGKSIQGLRLSAQRSLAENLDIFSSGGIQRGKYDQTNSSFLIVRDDLQVDFTFGASYRYTSNWTLRPQINLIQNHSNIIINQFDQADIFLTLRRDLK